MGELEDLGMGAEGIKAILIQKGWDSEEAEQIIQMAGIEAAGIQSEAQGATQYLQTATNPQTGERIGLTEEGRWVPIQ